MSDDFAYLDESLVDESTTAPYEFERVRGRPIFECACATQDNRAYVSALTLALQGQRSRKQAYDEMSEEQKKVEEQRIRLRDAKIFAETCVKSWKRSPVLRTDTLPDGTTKNVLAEFSPASTRKFLESLAARAPNVFDAFRLWLHTSGDFFRVSFEAAEETAKNSAGG